LTSNGSKRLAQLTSHVLETQMMFDDTSMGGVAKMASTSALFQSGSRALARLTLTMTILA